MAISKKNTPPAKRAAAKPVAKAELKVSSEPRRVVQSKLVPLAAPKAPVVPKVPLAASTPAKIPAAVATPTINVPQPKGVTFLVRADPGSKVALAGDFNKWDPCANPLTDAAGTGTFSTVLTLPPGNYEYKFVINGTWCVDPECTEWVQNNMGTLNSVCKV